MRTTTKTNITSLYEMPLDKPLGIDMQKFLQADPLSKYEGNDLELILESLKQNKVVEEVLAKRQQNLRNIQRWWSQGNFNNTINALSQQVVIL